MSVRAVEWALREAPGVPARCVAVLIGLAWHADENGRNAFPGDPALAKYARKSLRQARRDVAELRDAGLIREGDQALVSHYRPDRRPRVYDLAIGLTAGHTRPAVNDRPDTHDMSSVSQRPVVGDRPDVHDMTSVSERPVIHDRNGLSSMTAKRSKERSKKETYPTGRSSRDASRDARDAHATTADRPSEVDPLPGLDLPAPSASVAPDPAEADERTRKSVTGKRPSKSAGSTKKANQNGTRIPEDFAVTPEMVSWAQENAPDVNGRRATESFIDYWRGATGARARKRDWVATWRNWMRKEQDDAEQRPRARASPASNGLSTTDDTVLRLLNGQPLSGHANPSRALPPGDQP